MSETNLKSGRDGSKRQRPYNQKIERLGTVNITPEPEGFLRWVREAVAPTDEGLALILIMDGCTTTGEDGEQRKPTEEEARKILNLKEGA